MVNVFRMYITLLPVIFAGIFNMIFCKTKFYKRYNRPIDNGKNVFGNNKTWIGGIGMIFFTLLFQIIFSYMPFKNNNFIYDKMENTLLWNVIIGFLLGFAYILFELPNSFVKRRLKIEPGKTKNWISYIVDQIDSIIGVTIILMFFTYMPWYRFFLYILLGAITHSVINLILYFLKLRRNV